MTEQYDEYIDPQRLQNKTIEPDKTNEFATRNLQLGNIDKRLLIFYYHRLDRAMKYNVIATEYGGFLTKDFAKIEMDTINLQFIASGSGSGFVREINATQRKINDNRYTEQNLKRFGRKSEK